MYGTSAFYDLAAKIFFTHAHDMGGSSLTFTLGKVFIFLSIARFILGVGVGGVYPLAATVAAEGSSSECPDQKGVRCVGWIRYNTIYDTI